MSNFVWKNLVYLEENLLFYEYAHKQEETYGFASLPHWKYCEKFETIFLPWSASTPLECADSMGFGMTPYSLSTVICSDFAPFHLNGLREIH
jgi:hypothetical protein